MQDNKGFLMMLWVLFTYCKIRKWIKNKGCFLVLGAFALLLIGGISYSAYKSSYCYLMSEARGSGDVLKYVRAIDNNPDDDVTEALDSIVRLCKNGDISTIISMYDSYGQKYKQIDIMMAKASADLYAKTEKINTLDAWQSYKSVMPEKYQKDVNIQIQNAQLKAYNQKYDNAVKMRSVEVWNDFISEVPLEYQKDADQKLQDLKENLWKDEGSAWQEVLRTTSIDDYYKYLKLYPRGKHHKEAIDAVVASVMKTEHGDMPKMDRVGTSRGNGVSTITVSNKTTYALQILYSGPTSKQLLIPVNGIRQVTLADGEYCVSARVDAYNVEPYAGVVKLHGEYTSEYVIRTTPFKY